MKFKFIKKRIWGNIRYYPANDDAAALCELMGRKSLTVSQIKRLIGYEWEIHVEFDDKKEELNHVKF